MYLELNKNSYSVCYNKTYGISIFRMGQGCTKIYMYESILNISNEDLQKLNIEDIMIKNMFLKQDTEIEEYIMTQKLELEFINDYRKVLEQYKKFVVLQ